MTRIKKDIFRSLRSQGYSTSTFSDKIDSSSSAANYKPGFRTTSKLVAEYQQKHQQKQDRPKQDKLFSRKLSKEITQSTIWNLNVRVKLFKVLDNGYKEVNHRELIQAFKAYERKGDMKSTMHLCNRMKELNIIPHPICMESIIKVVEKSADSLVAQELYLNLLRSVGKHDIQLTKSTFGLLIGKLRYIKDAFVREAFYETAHKVIQTNERFQSFNSILNRDHTISCLNDGDMEMAFSKFIELEKGRELTGFPYDRFVQYLVDRADGLAEAMGIFHRHASRLNEMSIIYLLKENILRKNGEGAAQILAFLSESHGSVSLPTFYVVELITLLQNDTRTLPNIISLFAHSEILDKQVATALINSIASWKPLDNIGEALLTEKLIACLEILILQRNVRSKDLPKLGYLISEILQLKGMRRGTEFIVRKLDDCIQDTEIAHELDKDALTGHLMDTALIYYLNKRNPSEVFTLYGYFRQLSVRSNSSTTLELLLAAAEGLKHSKKLSYVICECFSNDGHKISKRAYERAIKNQLRGSNYDSVFYFLIQMTKAQVPLPRSLIRIIDSEFRKIDDRSFEKFKLLDDKSLEVFIRTNERFPSDDKLNQTTQIGEFRWSYNAEFDIRESERFLRRWNADTTNEHLDT